MPGTYRLPGRRATTTIPPMATTRLAPRQDWQFFRVVLGLLGAHLQNE